MPDPNLPPVFTSGGIATQKRFSKRQKAAFLCVLVLLLLGAGGGLAYWRFGQPESVEETKAVPEPRPEPAVLETVPQEPLLGDALFGSAQFQSETYKVGDIAIGGEAELLLAEDSPEPLEVTGVRGEAFTVKDSQEVKLVITWQTNKLSKAVIQYAKGVSQTPKTLEESDYAFNHSVVIPNLDQASTYVYSVKAQDRFGNESASDSYAVYTGSRTVSLFDLISNALGDVFGWTVRNE